MRNRWASCVRSRQGIADLVGLLAAVILMAGCARTATDTPRVETPGGATTAGRPVEPLTEEVVRNATYPFKWEETGEVTLTDGRYEGEPFVEGGTARPPLGLPLQKPNARS